MTMPFGFGKRRLTQGNELTRSNPSNRQKQEAMKGAERELMKFEVPKQELGMTSLVQQHQQGNRFLYAAITANQDEETASILRRLIKKSPTLNRRPIPIGKLPNLALYEETEKFELGKVLLPGKNKQVDTKGDKNKYIHITEVLVIFGSLISSDSAYSKVRINIIDDRLVGNKVAKGYTANTNLNNKAIMKLSYCFPKSESDKVSLTLSCEASFLEEGSQWGVVQVQLQMEELDFPIQTSNSEVRAINAIPQSVLEDRINDPDIIDISLNESNRQELREIYMNGDMADETEPISNKTEVTKYATTSLAGTKGKKFQTNAPGWEGLNNQRMKGVNVGANSVEPSEDGFSAKDSVENLRSAMRQDNTRSDSPPRPVRRVSVMDPNDTQNYFVN